MSASQKGKKHACCCQCGVIGCSLRSDTWKSSSLGSERLKRLGFGHWSTRVMTLVNLCESCQVGVVHEALKILRLFSLVWNAELTTSWEIQRSVLVRNTQMMSMMTICEVLCGENGLLRTDLLRSAWKKVWVGDVGIVRFLRETTNTKQTLRVFHFKLPSFFLKLSMASMCHDFSWLFFFSF